MPLQQTTRDGTTRLYDPETVRRTLARAAELEAQEKEGPLSAEQVEALGRELGLSPDAVRRSLGELEALQYRATVQPSVNATAPPVNEALPIFPENREIAGAMIPGILYGLFMGLTFLFLGRQMLVPGLALGNPILPLLRDGIIFYLPPLFAFWSGWQRRDWRLGGVSGLMLSLLSYAGMYIGLALSRSPYGLGALPGVFIAAILLGFFGGLCGRAQQRAKAARERAANR